jgi:Transposase
MIVIGADTHKRSHTCAAAKAGTGELAGEKTAAARRPGFRELLDWGRSLDPDRIWALEDCRHVSGSFERFLVDHGERVVRVPPKLMGESRKAERRAREGEIGSDLRGQAAHQQTRERRADDDEHRRGDDRAGCGHQSARVREQGSRMFHARTAHGSRTRGHYEYWYLCPCFRSAVAVAYCGRPVGR